MYDVEKAIGNIHDRLAKGKTLRGLLGTPQPTRDEFLLRYVKGQISDSLALDESVVDPEQLEELEGLVTRVRPFILRGQPVSDDPNLRELSGGNITACVPEDQSRDSLYRLGLFTDDEQIGADTAIILTPTKTFELYIRFSDGTTPLRLADRPLDKMSMDQFNIIAGYTQRFLVTAGVV